jgi:hypothetical protein
LYYIAYLKLFKVCKVKVKMPNAASACVWGIFLKKLPSVVIVVSVGGDTNRIL